MSGGHYDYGYFKVLSLADDIEREFVESGIRKREKWENESEEYDRLEDATPEERELILKEINSLIADLKDAGNRAKELEWYLSGDTGATTYLERISKL